MPTENNCSVSVIIPVYNRAQLIRRCLDGVANQKFPNMEVIVVDNGSTDSTLSEIEKWREKNRGNLESEFSFKLLTEPKRGACAARNKGLKEATGEWILFFDSDDLMLPDLLEKAMATVKESPDADIICWKTKINLLDGNIKIPAFLPDNPWEGHLIHTLLHPQGYMARKTLFGNAGGWNESLPAWNDWELGVRLLLLNPVIKGVDEVLAEIFSQKDSITGESFSSRSGVWEKSIEAVKREIDKTSGPLKSHLKRIIDYREIILAAHYKKEGNYSLAEKLKNRVVTDSHGLDKIRLFLSYHYTSKGGRGAWRIFY